MDFSTLLQDLKEPATALTAIMTALVAIVTAVYQVRVHLIRSRLLKSDAFPLPEVPSEQSIFADNFPELDILLVGRESAVREVSTGVRSSLLTSVYGESGSGKSTFLKLGLCRELVKTNWIPIYVDIWGTDWVGGPWKALADATDYAVHALAIGANKQPPITQKSVFEELRILRDRTGRRPLLIFDQVDDYQSAHRELFRNPTTHFFLKPDELCLANGFWKEVRSLLLHTGEPVHMLLATREDAQDALHCFEFTEPRVYRLPRLDPQDAVILMERLSPAAVIKNPENGFIELTRRIVGDLGDGQGAILPMQLRIALAGLGRMTGPLTPARLDKLGGVSALGALYLNAVLRTSPGAWPVLNAMAERTPTGGGKARTLPYSQLCALIPADTQPSQLLQHLAATRILRQRLAGSPDEVWQLYHDYLADAIVAVDRGRRRWSLILSAAADRFWLSEGLLAKWTRLLVPSVQLKLLWQRLRDRDFRYGKNATFARLSVIRLLVNLGTISLAVGLWGWAFWQDTRNAQSIVDAFHQGRNHEKDEYDALWRLAASRSDRMRRDVFLGFLSTADSAEKFRDNSSAVFAALGLRLSSLDALKNISTTGPCQTLSQEYLTTCKEIALYSGGEEGFANRTAELLATSTGRRAADLGYTLATVAAHLKGDQVERGANRIVELLDKASKDEALGNALAELAPYLKGNQAERGAYRLMEMQGSETEFEASFLRSKLGRLSAQVKGVQAERLANHIIELLEKGAEKKAAALADALVALAPALTSEQAERGVDRIGEILPKAGPFYGPDLLNAYIALLAQLKGESAEYLANRTLEVLAKATPHQAGELNEVLAAVIPHLKRDQAELAANRVLELLGRAKEDDAANLGETLAKLTAQMTGDQAERRVNRVVELLGRSTGYEAVYLGKALAALATQAMSAQVNRGATRIVELLAKAVRGDELTRDLGKTLAILSARSKDDQAYRGASRVADLLVKARPHERIGLASALTDLSAHLKGDQAKSMADRIVELRSKANDDGYRGELDNTLAALAPLLKNDQAESLAYGFIEAGQVAGRGVPGRATAALLAYASPGAREHLLAELLNERQAIPCGSAVINMENRELLVDMLKWPICTDRDGVMLRVAELQRARPTEFGEFSDPRKRSTFHGDSRRFISWLKTQRDSSGRPFDVDGPPMWSPGHPHFSVR